MSSYPAANPFATVDKIGPITNSNSGVITTRQMKGIIKE